MLRSLMILLLMCLGHALTGPLARGSQSLAPLKVSDSGRYLVTQDDGKPFFWLADTGWHLFHRLKPVEVDRYLEDRAAKGFTVLQTMIVGTDDEFQVSGSYGGMAFEEGDPNRPVEAFFKNVDAIVAKANSMGLRVAIAPTWGNKVRKTGPNKGTRIFDAKSARDYGEYVGRRYRDAAVVWIVGGDCLVEKGDGPIWRALAEGLIAGSEGQHLITGHFRSHYRDGSGWHFHNQPWLDFNFAYSGHVWNAPSYEAITLDRIRTPIKPVIDGEPPYEGHPYLTDGQLYHSRRKLWDGKLRGDAHQMRQAAYWAMLAGAAGHSYGANDMWQFFDLHRGDEALHHPTTPWTKALDFDGARQMGIMRRLFESFAWETLVPDQGIIASGQGSKEHHAQAARGNEGSYAMVYLPMGDPVSIRMDTIFSKEERKVTARWFNPRDGKWTAIGSFKNSGTHEFTPPTSGKKDDWVLVLQSAGDLEASKGTLRADETLAAASAQSPARSKIDLPFAGYQENRYLAQAQDAGPSYLNSKLSVAERVADLLGRMSLEEKVGQMDQYVAQRYLAGSSKKKPSRDRQLDQLIVEGAVGSLIFVIDPNEANAYQKLAEKSRLKIPLLFCIDAVHGLCPVRGATVLPSPIGLASSFNTELVERVQQVTAKEMRAIGIGWALHPMLGIARDPRWGRMAELFGEDTFLTTEMARAVVRGFQGRDLSDPDNVVACAKTFLAHSVPMGGRNFAPADVSERTLRSVFMPPYQAAVEEGVFSLMPAYHELNGIPCHGSKALLTDVFRDQWGFTGFIVSDWGGVEMLQNLHGTASTHADAVQQAVLAGIDIHMKDGGFGKTLVQLVKEGVISEKRIDQSVARLLTAKFRLGHFENRYVDPEKVAQVLFCEEHRKVSLQSAIQSMVLLENKDRLLPLDKNIRSILVTGPNADNTAILGDWTAVQPDANCVTVLEGIQEKVSPTTKVYFEDVGKNWEITNETIARVVQAAKQAEVAVVVVGGNHTRFNEQGELDRGRKERTGGEATDRADLKLVGKQLKLVQKIHATGTPTVVVLVNGRSLAIPWIAKNIPAVLEAWEPGSEGGHAVADLLFGDANPSGKLPVSFPVSVGQLPVYYNHPPSAEKGYQTIDSKPVYSFGHGLSYTSFELSNLVVPERVTAGEPILVSVDVQNTGERAGDEIVLLYVRDVVSSVVTPVKELKGFQRTSLLPGKKKKMHFRIPFDLLALYNREMKKVVEPGVFEILVGDMKKEIVLQETILE